MEMWAGGGEMVEDGRMRVLEKMGWRMGLQMRGMRHRNWRGKSGMKSHRGTNDMPFVLAAHFKRDFSAAWGCVSCKSCVYFSGQAHPRAWTRLLCSNILHGEETIFGR